MAVSNAVKKKSPWEGLDGPLLAQAAPPGIAPIQTPNASPAPNTASVPAWAPPQFLAGPRPNYSAQNGDTLGAYGALAAAMKAGQDAPGGQGGSDPTPSPDYGREGSRTPGVNVAGPTMRPPVATPNATPVPNVAANGAKQTTPLNLLQAAGAPGSTLDGGGKPGTAKGPPVLGPDGLPAAQRPELTDEGGYLVPPQMPSFPGMGQMPPMKGTKSNETDSSGATAGTSAATATPTDDYLTAYGRTVDGTPAMRRMRSDVDAFRGGLGWMAANEQNKTPAQRIDLSPALGLADTWFGGNQAASYHRPLENQVAIGNLANGLLGNESKLTDAESKFLHDQLTGTATAGAQQAASGGREASVNGGGAGPGMEFAKFMMEFGNKLQQQDLGNRNEQAAAAAKATNETPDAQGIYNSLKNIDKMAKAYHTGSTNVLPGYGGNLIPGASNPVTQGINSALSGFHNPTNIGMSPDGKALRSEMTNLSMLLNHSTFGARLTPSEQATTAQLLEFNQNQTPQEMLAAIGRVQDIIRGKIDANRSLLTPEQQKVYDSGKQPKAGDFNFDFDGIVKQPKDPIGMSSEGAPAADKKAAAATEVRRVGEGGKVHIFDAKTKKYLRDE